VLEIIETPIFTRAIRELLGDEEYRLLQWGLVVRPELGALVPGGNGLRKLRWAGSSGGKRGGLRVLYYWDRAVGTVYLLYVYSKREQVDLTRSQIAILAKLISEEFK
jgi:mRNA-degrading endonuclease RelE of RelBE toxin-antitoxin system